jgi:hypothetical protein
MDLRAALPHLLPLAIEWAEKRSSEIRANGAALTDEYSAVARAVGVARTELVRVMFTPALPLPEHPLLRQAAIQTGLLGPSMVGLTLGYGVLVVNGHASRRLLSHELRHVHQYEAAGSIAAYLPVYLKQIVDFGYANAPLERDARGHEIATSQETQLK